MADRSSSTFSRPQELPAKSPTDSADRREEEFVRLAMALHVQGRLREAKQLCVKLLSRNPRNSRAHYIIGRIALDRGDNDLATQHFKQALEGSPREPLFLIACGDARGNDHEAAIEYYRTALSIRPDMIEALSRLARAYMKTGDAEAARKSFAAILRLDPDHGTARLGLATALAAMGQKHEASAVLRESIRRRKAAGAAYNALAKMQKFASEPPELREILQNLEQEGVKPAMAINLHHAAGKILDDLKRYGEAFEHFKRANLAFGGNFDIDACRQGIDGIIEAFSAEFLKTKAGFGDKTELPVFILGMPRSGTTLTEQICSSHTSVFGAGESAHLRRILGQSGFEKTSLTEFRRALAAVTPEQSLQLVAKYLRSVLKADSPVLRFTDKTPHNFELIGFIALLFPNARIIHCRRDPIDTCVSCFTTSFNEQHTFKTDLTNLGLYYREYNRLMEHWNAVLPGRIFECRYEALIAQQEVESRRLIEYLGLPWDDNCLRFEQNDRTVFTASNWQVRQPIYTSSVKRWKNYEREIQPLIEALGDLADV